jgi:hypothetical protein
MKEVEKEIKQFKDDVSKEYIRTRKIDKIINLQASETDGKYIQIAIRQLIDEDWFKQEGSINSFGFLGKSISLGELNFLISEVLNTKNITLGCKKISELISKINSFGSSSTSIIMPIDFFYDRFLPHTEGLISCERNGIIKYNGMPIFLVNKTKLEKNKIILIDKECGVWFYKNNTDNKITDSLFIDVLNKELKFDITIKSVNKLEINSPEYIQIMALDEEGKENKGGV